ncbi:7SK snRNA methylphosphate capping enzyme [Arapaima gigas]
MIEMPVDKEMGDTQSDSLGHLQTLLPKGTQSGLHMAQAQLHVAPGGDCCMMDTVGLGTQRDRNPFCPKNGLHQSQQHKPNKRRHSVSTGFKQPGCGKRRRRANSESEPVLPTNFLLGGNIFDPLNLNSLLDEEVNRTLNAETPKSSPLPPRSHEPVEILIPRDITDPLNLNSGAGDEGILVSSVKCTGRRRHRNRHHGAAGAFPVMHGTSESDTGKATEGCVAVLLPGRATSVLVPEMPREGAVLLCLSPVTESPRPYELNTSINCRDDIVPPILPVDYLHSYTPCISVSNANCASSQWHRRRRRARSKVDPCHTPPLSSARKDSAERIHHPGTQKCPQTFHTPVGHGDMASVATVNRSRLRRECRFQYGSYNPRYGYCSPGICEDPRMCLLKPEWFRGKLVLDLGCNTGHLTLCIAKKLRPAHILGLDINGDLVRAARHNLRHFLSEGLAQEARLGVGVAQAERPQGQDVVKDADGRCSLLEPTGLHPVGMEPKWPLSGVYFPVSLRIGRGPLAAPPLCAGSPGNFPANISFVQENYILESEAQLLAEQPQYDVILCLRLTKWVQLNWGDSGLQRLFKRAFRNLRPGGLFILEPQPWSSYGRRKKLTDTTYKNYRNIRLRPDQFSSYLTSKVGFCSYELLGASKTTSRGPQGVIYLFHKGPSSSRK